MPRTWKPDPKHELGVRLRELMKALGLDEHGGKTKLAKGLGVKLPRLSWWLSSGGAKLETWQTCVLRLASAYPAVREPETTARWLADGGKRPDWLGQPANPDDATDPRRSMVAGSVDHKTPSFGTAMPTIVDPEVAIDRAIEDVKAGRIGPGVAKLVAAKALLVALKAARNAGLAGVLIAGTYGDVQANAKIRREEITKWAEVEALREEVREEARRRQRRTGSGGR